MEQIEDALGMLDLMTCPALCVKNGTIAGANQAAKSYFIEPGQDFTALLATGGAEYAEFSGGCLYLTLTISGQICDASITRVGALDVVLIEADTGYPELRAMALAAQELRAPLTGIMATADRLFPALDEQASATMREQTAYINRGLFQMQRILGNMADALRYYTAAPRLETQDICALLWEIFQRATQLSGSTGPKVEFTCPPTVIHCGVDAEKLERAVYNLVSNAMKFSPKDSVIRAALTLRGNRLHLTVEDAGSGIPDAIRGSVFSRYRRTPSIEDGRCGIGLGLVLVRAAAAVHGGAVLMARGRNGGTRVTLTMAVQQPSDASLRSPIYRVDYAGERDHGLVELSEVLPASLYENENIH